MNPLVFLEQAIITLQRREELAKGSLTDQPCADWTTYCERRAALTEIRLMLRELRDLRQRAYTYEDDEEDSSPRELHGG